ncbi:baseplate J/gp47 family protein [Hydrocarboniphaga effusa]|uniref:baseplate J/gp47 family protein n=1 Tax=Hydrocarboniphaga effusa TaxID=243629 RepID=UPI003BACD1EB
MFVRPSLQELISRTTADLVSRLEITSEVLRRAIVRVEARVWAGVAHLLHGHLDWNSRQLFATTADGSELDRHGADLLLPRLAPQYASGLIEVQGAEGVVIPAGTRWQIGEVFESTAEVEIGVTTIASISVRAVEAGTASNLAAGTKMTLISPIANVYASATVPADGIAGGSDGESDSAYRARVLERKRNTPQGGALNDYVRWVREVSSAITRVWVYPSWLGAGSVGVTFVCDDAESIIPSAPLVDAVQVHIDQPDVRPVMAEVIVFAPTPQAIPFSIALTPNTSAVRTAVQAELADLLRRQGKPPYTIALSLFDEAISLAAGEESHVMSAPAAPVTVDAGHAPVLGAITWL